MVKKILVLIAFVFVTADMAQGMFTQTGRFSLDVGTAYINNVGSPNAMSYNLSTSILGIADLGINYFKSFQSTTEKQVEGNTAYLDLYAKKDTTLGVVLNLSYSQIKQTGIFLAGVSFYGRFVSLESPSIVLYPVLSLGYLNNEDYAYGIGISVEKKINKNISLVFTPSFNKSKSSDGQLVIGGELIFIK